MAFEGVSLDSLASCPHLSKTFHLSLSSKWQPTSIVNPIQIINRKEGNVITLRESFYFIFLCLLGQRLNRGLFMYHISPSQRKQVNLLRLKGLTWCFWRVPLCTEGVKEEFQNVTFSLICTRHWNHHPSSPSSQRPSKEAKEWVHLKEWVSKLRLNPWFFRGAQLTLFHSWPNSKQKSSLDIIKCGFDARCFFLLPRNMKGMHFCNSFPE